jgi:hypothetical protein
LEDLRDLAVGIVEISEETDTRRANLDALRRKVTDVDPLEAEGTFFRDTDGPHGDQRVPDLKLRLIR